MRPTNPSRARGRRQSGVELVEFALVLPALCALLLVVGQVGGAVGAHQVLSNAAREAARFAAAPEIQTDANAVADIQDRAIEYAAANGITLPAADIAVTQGATETTVAISGYPYAVSGLLGIQLTLGAAVTMGNLYR